MKVVQRRGVMGRTDEKNKDDNKDANEDETEKVCAKGTRMIIRMITRMRLRRSVRKGFPVRCKRKLNVAISTPQVKRSKTFLTF